MSNIWKLFVGDLKRLGGNTITILVILGLVLIPSLFSWYNMLACWDVFDHTGRLTVAVANSDEGYESDLVPLELNIGERVISALRENDQLNWVFTSEEDAVDGTQSGRYYAAVVIPKDFSRNMMSFFDADAESANIIYYSNEKKSAIAPKVTDQGADQVSSQVNRVFTETLSEIALAIASSLYDYADSADVNGSIAELANHLTRVSSQLSRSAQTIEMYAEVLDSAQTLVSDSSTLLEQAKQATDGVRQSAASAKQSADSTKSSLEDAVTLLSEALDQSSAGFAAIPDAVDAAFDSADSLAADSAAQLRDRAATADAIAADFRSLAANVSQLATLVPDEQIAQKIANLVKHLEDTALLEEGVRDALNNAATSIENDSGSSQETRAQVKDLATQAAANIDAAKSEYESNLKPTLTTLSETLQHATQTLSGTSEKLDSVGGEMSGISATLTDDIGDTRKRLATAAANLNNASAEMQQLGSDISQALSTGDASELRKVIGSNPNTLATALSAPVAIERIAVYPVENFGSAMSPLYTTLALWIGSLLMMVTLRLLPSERSTRDLKNPRLYQLFCGRFGIVALISFMQSTVLALGNLLFLGVQAENPLLYMLCFWVAGLVFAFIIYTLVVTFGNLGKAFGVILLILQVSGGGGSFPMQLLPQPIQDISPFLPITHVVNAMRAAMFGLYNNDFWYEMGIVVLFAVPFVVLGLALRAPILKGVERFVKKVEASKLM